MPSSIMVNQMIDRLYGWYGKKTVRIVAVVIVITIIAGFFLRGGENSQEEQNNIQLRTVETASVFSIVNEQVTELIGTVEAINEAHIETETSGRITSVLVELGDVIARGEVIARIENASERAAVLQAEGVYEASLSAAAQSDVGVNNAKNNAVSIYRNAYTTVNDIVLNTIDDLFSDPQAATPGLRVEGLGNTAFLNSERIAYRTLLPAWQKDVASVSISDDLKIILSDARIHIVRTLNIVDTFLTILPEQSVNGIFLDSEIGDFQKDFITAQQSLNSTLTAIDSAREALASAELGGTNTNLSAANARVKQALGALRSAQAALEKTIIRSPLNGTVNSIDVKIGDFVGSFAPVATIANNNALEITTFIGESDRDRIAVGDIVLIEGSLKGVVARIAPAFDPATGKIEVEIQTEAETLKNGDTVTLVISPSETNTVITDTVRIPLTAVKLTSDRAFVFTVEDGVLIEHEVALGKANGSVVIIESGIESEWEIVLDARGLNNGVRVNIAN